MLYVIERRSFVGYMVERGASLQAQVISVSVGKATGPRGPGSTFERLQMPGPLVIGVGQVPLIFSRPVDIVNTYVSAPTAPTGSDALFDLNLNGVTMFTNQAHRNRIVAGTTLSANVVPDIFHVPAGGALTVDVDQVGSLVAGANALYTIEYV